MVNLKNDVVEKVISEVIKEINDILKIDVALNGDVCPGSIAGISSQILITVMGRLEIKLGVTIPDDCYIFHDKITHKQLSIREAAQKLIKVAKDGN